MNTLSDTDEGRARPSRWPVYVMSGIIGLFSLSHLSWVWFVPLVAQMPTEVSQELSLEAQRFYELLAQLVPYVPLFAVYGLFGLATAVGAALFRRWAWWCAAAWLLLYIGWTTYLAVNLRTGFSPIGVLLTVVFCGLIIWPLSIRRPLFLATKAQRGENAASADRRETDE